ncbi:hypothetical protein [Fischerella sp. PCC 9605]|uniref:hypothetical protein n=1 Tax=Fischerella sp. PCC 9605 TaxID=1173024 RepID=UPI000478DDF9|nr:hypothetical protein [Fischerella sp. PCC 9605]
MPLTVEARKAQLSLTIDPKIKNFAIVQAKKENRTVSNLFETAMKLYLEKEHINPFDLEQTN